jgi:hypothetical protein
LEKTEIAALLESLCERPFAGDPEGGSPAMAATASHIAQALSKADAERPESPGQPGAELAAILSGTPTEAQCRAFHEAAATSGAARLEAQSALAFVDGIEQAPLAAPAHLVEEIVASVGGARSRAGVWSGLSGSLIGGWRGRAAAACAVMLMAGGLSWSLFRPDAGPGSVEPLATAPKEAESISAVGPFPAAAPAVVPAAAPAALPVEPTPTLPMPAAPAPAAAAPAAVQALTEPCTPRSVAKSEAQAASDVRFRVTRPAPKQPSNMAGLTAPDPGCAGGTGSRLVVNPAAEGAAGRSPRADRGPVRADRPAAQIDRLDRSPAGAAASAPAARPASPGMRPSSIQQSR